MTRLETALQPAFSCWRICSSYAYATSPFRVAFKTLIRYSCLVRWFHIYSVFVSTKIVNMDGNSKFNLSLLY